VQKEKYMAISNRQRWNYCWIKFWQSITCNE